MVALEAALEAERAELDGVFVYDHLFPLGRQPGAPAAECITLLAAIAARTERLRVGTLVLRAGLRPSWLALDALRTVATVAPGRLVVGLGTGDNQNARENEAFAIPLAPVAERLAEVVELATALQHEGIEVWIGGLGRRVREACAEVGAVWNCWNVADADLVRMLAEVPQRAVTWGGPEPPASFSVPVDEVVTTPR
jgi:alkanesulfonate monooxygenase SsuD/methylene tetrahydromethanopterin reductase-like flavin-dependent oxidoreductase (luciferase family)